MAVYSTFPVATPTLFEPTDFAWHTVHPVLAALGKEQGAGGKEDGAVYLFSAEGDQLDEVVLQRVSHPKCMAWHPTEQLLAVGFGNGEIVICNAVSGHIQDCKVRRSRPPLARPSRLRLLFAVYRHCPPCLSPMPQGAPLFDSLSFWFGCRIPPRPPPDERPLAIRARTPARSALSRGARVVTRW